MPDIVLGGLTFPTVITGTANFISPWLARLGTGEPRFSELEPSSHYVMRTVGAGFGKDRGDIFEDTGRFWDSTCWSHIDARPHLPGATAAGTYAPTAAPAFIPYGHTRFDGNEYIWGHSNGTDRPLHTLSGTTYTEVTTAGAPADAADIADVAVQGGDMFVALTGGSDLLRVVSGGGAWSAPAAGEQAHALCAFQDDIVVKAFTSGSNTAAIEKSDDRGATWTSG